MFDQLNPSQITGTAVLLAVVVSMWRGWLIPGAIYQRAIADIELKDKVIDRLTVTLERLSRRNRNRE